MRKNKYPIPENLAKHFEGNFLKVYFGKRKTNKMNLVRKHRPYGKVRILDTKEFAPDVIDVCTFGMPSKYGNTRNRKATRRIYNKRTRAQYKRELISAIEDHIFESMYDPYELDYDIISADMVYDRIMNREVEENLFEDFGYSLYDYDSDFDYFLDA